MVEADITGSVKQLVPGILQPFTDELFRYSYLSKQASVFSGIKGAFIKIFHNNPPSAIIFKKYNISHGEEIKAFSLKSIGVIVHQQIVRIDQF